jgi:hypothetical protein
VTILALSFTTACSGDPEYDAYCVERATEVRVDDRQCDDDQGGSRYGWFYVPAGSISRHPDLGTKVAKVPGSSYTEPTGAKVSRGGFGSTGASKSSGS